MKFSKIILLAIILIVPSLAYPLVRLKNVSQSGQGRQGIIKIEFNGNYDPKKSSLNVLEDRAEVTIPDSFVIPVRRVYKPSSGTSSVVKMEVNQIPGNAVKVSVFFRVPMSTIKNSAKLTGSLNSVMLNYSLDAPAVENQNQAATNEAKPNDEATQTQDNKDNTTATNSEVTARIDENKDSKNTKRQDSFLDEKKDGKKDSSSGFMMAILRMVGALLVVIGLFLAGVFLFKKYLSGGMSLGLKKKPLDLPIKMISTFAIAPGKTLYLINVLGEILLLSSGKEGLSLISKISNQKSNSANDTLSDPLKDSPDSDFMNDDDIPEVSVPSPMATSDIKTKLKERLRSIKGA